MKLPNWLSTLLIPTSFLAFLLWIWVLVSTQALPDPVAIHWGISLEPDGFIPASQYLVLNSSILGSAVLLYLGFALWTKRMKLLRRFIGFTFAGVYWMLFLIMFTATAIQISASDAAAVRFPVAALAVLLLLIPGSIWVFLAFPTLEIGSSISVRLRGIKFLDLQFSEIASASLENIYARQYGGLGIRFRGKRIAFIPSKGEALVLKLQTGEEVAIRVRSGQGILSQITPMIRG